jgi:hypothetical protein
MSGPERYFFEIPIYRCPIDKHTREMERDKYNWARELRESENPVPECIASAQRHWENTQWYPWRYNEVVGWLRLYVMDRQVRGELWYVRAKRLVPRPKKPMFLAGEVFLTGFHPRQTDKDILSELRAELFDFQKSKRMKGRFLDLECFSCIAPSICWRRLLGFEPGASSSAVDKP